MHTGGFEGASRHGEAGVVAGRPLPAVVAGDDDSLEDVIGRVVVAGRDGAPVDLAVPRDSSLLLTAAEFRRLRDAIDRERLGVTLRSDDPLRAQLAGLLGIPEGPLTAHLHTLLARKQREAAERVAVAPSVVESGIRSDRASGRPADGAVVGRNGGVAEGMGRGGRTPLPETPPAEVAGSHGPPREPGRAAIGAVATGAASEPKRPPLADPEGGAVGDEPVTQTSLDTGQAWPAPPDFSTAAPPRRGRRFGRPRKERPPAEPGGAATFGPEVVPVAAGPVGAVATNGRARVEPAPDAAPTFGEVAARRQRRGLPRWLAVALGAILLVGLGALAVALLMPRATVAIALDRVAVAGTLTYAIGVDGAAVEPGTIAVAARPTEVEVEVEESVPTTGRRLIPDGTAAAPLQFANPNPEPAAIEAGTRLASLNGVEFVVAERVEVPAADPASGAAGRAAGEARAVERGGGGNVGTGEIGGRLDNGVYYSNREAAATGGTDREEPAVAAADREAAAAALAAAVEAAAVAEAGAALDEAVEVVPGSLEVIAEETTFGAAEGEPGATLTARRTATVRLLAFDRGSLEGQLEAGLGSAIPVPTGRVLDASSVRFGESETGTASPDGTTYTMPVEVDAVVPLGPAERRALAERLAGTDLATAEAILAGMTGLRSWSFDFQPSWLPNRMPGDPDRIEIEVVG